MPQKKNTKTGIITRREISTFTISRTIYIISSMISSRSPTPSSENRQHQNCFHPARPQLHQSENGYLDHQRNLHHHRNGKAYHQIRPQHHWNGIPSRSASPELSAVSTSSPAPATMPSLIPSTVPASAPVTLSGRTTKTPTKSEPLHIPGPSPELVHSSAEVLNQNQNHKYLTIVCISTGKKAPQLQDKVGVISSFMNNFMAFCMSRYC